MIYVKRFPDGVKDSECGRTLLDTALKIEYGKQLSDFEIIYLPGGKPVFKNADIHFNISHSGTAAAVVLSSSPVGIDIQRIHPYNPALANRICTAYEKTALSSAADKAYMLYSLWSMRESYVKYTGEGLRGSIRDIDYTGKSYSQRVLSDFVLSVSPSPHEIAFI